MADWVVKYDGPCSKCNTTLHVGEVAVWDRATKKMSCIECPAVDDPSPPPIEFGEAGASARHEYARRIAKREAELKKRWGSRIGGLINRLADEPQSIKAWGLGARGEELLAAALASVPDVFVLHDRRAPGTRGNVDHIVVAPAGVFVIDAKYYEGLIEVRDRGGFFRVDLRLMVRGRDKSALARGMPWQVRAVEAALVAAEVEPIPPITAVLCFVDGRWPIFRPPKAFEGVRLESERSIVRLFDAPAMLDSDGIEVIARILAHALPAKRVSV